MTKPCRAGGAQRSGNIKALVPLSFQITHSHSSACRLTAYILTLSRAVTHCLPSGTSQLMLCLWVLCRMQFNGYFSVWFRINRTLDPGKYRLKWGGGVKIMIGGGLETKAVNYYGWLIYFYYIHIYIYFLLLYILYRKLSIVFF